MMKKIIHPIIVVLHNVDCQCLEIANIIEDIHQTPKLNFQHLVVNVKSITWWDLEVPVGNICLNDRICMLKISFLLVDVQGGEDLITLKKKLLLGAKSIGSRVMHKGGKSSLLWRRSSIWRSHSRQQRSKQNMGLLYIYHKTLLMLRI